MTRFVIPWVPVSKKNSGRIILNRRTGKRQWIPGRKAEIQEKAIHVDALVARGKKAMPPPDHDLSLTIRYLVDRDEVEVEVEDLGAPDLAGRTGRRHDVPNLPILIADALQGALYDNDRQIARLHVERVYGPFSDPQPGSPAA